SSRSRATPATAWGHGSRRSPRASCRCGASSPWAARSSRSWRARPVRRRGEGPRAGTGEAAGLSIAEGFVVHYVDQVGTSHQVQVRDWTGTRVPMHAVSSGLVFLAQLPGSTLDVYLEHPLDAFTPRTLTAPDALRERLAQVRVDGYAWVHE